MIVDEYEKQVNELEVKLTSLLQWMKSKPSSLHNIVQGMSPEDYDNIGDTLENIHGSYYNTLRGLIDDIDRELDNFMESVL